MKTAKTKLKELRRELRDYQMIVRMDMRALARSIAKCKEIAAKMREIQKGDGANES